MAKNLSSHPYIHLLSEVSNLSPAHFISFDFGTYDEDGWPTWVDFAIGDYVLSRSNKRYQVIGFTIDNEVIVKQADLDYDPAIRYLTFRAEGLRHEPKPEAALMYRSGLVAFG